MGVMDQREISRPRVRTTADEIIDFLATHDDPELGEIVALAADLCGTAGGGISVLRDGHYHLQATVGLDPLTVPADDTFCQFAMDTRGVYAIDDACADERCAQLSWVNGQGALTRFYASAPLITADGLMVGRLCVLDPVPHKLSTVQRRALETLASNVMRALELRLAQGSADALPLTHTVARIAELSHDLRVPTASIVASTEMLVDELEGHSSPAVQALLRRLEGATQRMTQMLEHTMAWSAQVRVPAPRQAVDLAAVARQFVDEAHPWLAQRQGRVELGPLPVVHASPDQMYSVIQNLVTNAVKFARPGVAPVVRVTSQRTEGGHRVSVADNGMGIPPERRDDVFAMFTTSGRGGHGIGLATVHRIVTARGGALGITESASGGAEVWFTLPD